MNGRRAKSRIKHSLLISVLFSLLTIIHYYIKPSMTLIVPASSTIHTIRYDCDHNYSSVRAYSGMLMELGSRFKAESPEGRYQHLNEATHIFM